MSLLLGVAHWCLSSDMTKKNLAKKIIVKKFSKKNYGSSDLGAFAQKKKKKIGFVGVYTSVQARVLVFGGG